MRTVALTNIADVIDCEHKTAPKDPDGEFISVRTSDIKNGKIAYEACNRVSEETYVKWTQRGQPEMGDIVLAREAPVGEVGYVQVTNLCLGQRTVLIKITDNQVDGRWLTYKMTSRKCKHDLRVMSTGSTVEHLNMSDIRAYELDIPPLPEQQRIAGILSAFDDKIDVLRRQNATLEAMAQTVFREWFVERREDDWEEVAVGDLATHVKNSVKPGSFPQEAFVHYSLPAFDDSKRPVSELGLEIRSSKYEVPTKSILVSKLNPRFPRVWWVDEAPKNAVCSTEFQVVKPKDIRHTAFLLSFLKSRYACDALMMSASGTSGSHQRVRPKDIFDLSIPMPSEEAIIEFQKLIWPKMEKAIRNRVAMETTESLKQRALKNLLNG